MKVLILSHILENIYSIEQEIRLEGVTTTTRAKMAAYQS